MRVRISPASAYCAADAVEESGCRFGDGIGRSHSPDCFIVSACFVTLGCLSFGGERLSLRVDALVDAEPVEQFFAAFGSQIAACTVEVVGRVGAERGNVLPGDGVEESGFTAAGRTEEADDGVFGGEFAALAEAFEGFGGVEQHSFGDSSFAVADGVLQGCDGAREGRGRHGGGGASLGMALSGFVLEFGLGGSHSAFFLRLWCGVPVRSGLAGNRTVSVGCGLALCGLTLALISAAMFCTCSAAR